MSVRVVPEVLDVETHPVVERSPRLEAELFPGFGDAERSAERHVFGRLAVLNRRFREVPLDDVGELLERATLAAGDVVDVTARGGRRGRQEDGERRIFDVR